MTVSFKYLHVLQKPDPKQFSLGEVISPDEQAPQMPSINSRADEPIFIILAAGKGSRFGGRSKVLQDLCGKRILDLVLEIAGQDKAIIVGSSEVAKIYGPEVVVQEKPTGNGDAFLLGLKELQGKGPVVVLMGDSPLILRSDINRGLNFLSNNEVVIGKFKGAKEGYGRVVEYPNNCKIYDPSEMPMGKFSSAGWICFRRDFINQIIAATDGPIVAKTGENPITDYVNFAKYSCAIEVSESSSIGINSREDYRSAYQEVQRLLMDKLFMRGVDFASGECSGLRFDTMLGAGTIVHQNVVFGPKVTVGENCTLGPFCYLESCKIGDNCCIGPFCHVRGKSIIGNKCHIGSFCEINRSELGDECKSKHFSYLGDGKIGRQVNIGAGTVFCNYNGHQKQTTKVGERSFLGSGSLYIAPVEIGEDSYVGAGTVVSKKVESKITCIDKRQRIDYYRIENESKEKEDDEDNIDK